MIKKIIRYQETNDGDLNGLHPVLNRVFSSRKITALEEAELGMERLHPPARLGGLDRAVALIEQVMAESGRILVIGDFDADGATSCALAIRALRAMGVDNVGYLVPNRFEYGYGLTPEIVQDALARQPDLIITVDNGISSHDGVAAAKTAGVKVLVTDHHLPGAELPAADAIVNPNCSGDDFPSKNLAGVGVVFYLLAALRTRLSKSGWFQDRVITVPNLAAFLDLVALGSVADVVPLDQNNRILIHHGLQRIRAGKCCMGIQALLDVAGKNRGSCIASDMGFSIGPRLNAAGRLDDMALGIECLLADDYQTARDIAQTLDSLNRQRREIEAGMQQQALEALESITLGDNAPVGICIYQPDWHQGIIGILAARIKERFHRPVIAFAQAEEEGVLKGSARSIPGLHMRDTLDEVATANPGLILKFGGHAGAAGLSIRTDDLSSFSSAFDEHVRMRLDDAALQGVILSDGPLEPNQLTLELATLLREASPWGQGFPEPLFDGKFVVISHRVVGEKHLKMVLRPEQGKNTIDAIAFNQAEATTLDRDAVIEAAYRLDVNEYMGRRSAQLIVEQFETVIPA
ncbi:single-stranded-DNA-specific exonuclease RecJ [Solemya velesiana gill symbiont]|uniref:Single-stranded-DNA-specific exonuclease RecJ n=1 Tax=Solemya velesiana gill symbiont TaxID=1918948 RepID=A0A1T2KSP1_9GAMM|nr:single-stranded-DNA-specific exonuclease RecJ [Solemya velesiana gill symbiont]OOZ35888.1 single-stranded-DNA-specific exonuclease RecJ [Solemya velesiana gill symbiont]